MTLNEFINYMTENLESYSTFQRKAFEFQFWKNNLRKKKWNETRIERAANDMWKQTMQNLYLQLKTQIKSTNSDWNDYIKRNEIISLVNEGIFEIEFE